MEGIVGSVSRYTETRGFDVTKAEVGFIVAATKRSSSSFDFWMGVDSTEIFPCRERRMRICEAMRLEVRSHDTPVPHLVGLTKIPAFQGRITSALEPIKRELRECGPRMLLGGRDQPVHRIREKKVR